MIITEVMLKDFAKAITDDEKSPMTVQKYLRDVSFFSAFLANRPVSKELVIGYKATLQEKGYAVTSINSMLSSVNSFLKFCGLADCCVKQLKMQREIYVPKEKELTKSEYFRLVTTAQKQNKLRLSVLIQTIGATGIRISELRYFTVESVRTGRVIVQCKNKNRVVIVADSLKKILLDYSKKTGINSGCIFVTKSGNALDRSNIWRELKSLCHEAGVDEKKVYPHNLRKLFARTYYKTEKDIAKLADILGHSSIDTTRIYIKDTGLEHKRQIERMGMVIL